MSPLTLLRSGDVQRYHSNPTFARFGQKNSEHQWRCVTLLLKLNPGVSRNALMACHLHDAGELGAGDLAYPFKKNNPELASEHARIEADYATSIGRPVFALTTEEQRWIKMVDRLESTLWSIEQLGRRPQGWAQNNAELYEEAEALGVLNEVYELIQECEELVE